jgi:hypothetical protein
VPQHRDHAPAILFLVEAAIGADLDLAVLMALASDRNLLV